ncbi:Ig-like domain-containing protein [Pseudomonas chlororaphis]|uniref:Ig-like domain-containing protein n=1 Tax=Pseudomonas chlororaphis TaxID=587753 RepID=UPI002407EF24|nr:Ig-like domain-containing protein [Pseudomonas chlororaphis]
MKENPLSRWVDKPRPLFKRLMVGYLALVTGCTNTVENLEHASAQENSRSSAYHYGGDSGKVLDKDKSQLPELYGSSRPEKQPPAAKGSFFEGPGIPAEQQLIADPFNSRSKGGDELQSMAAGALGSAASTEVKEWFSARHATAELSLTAGKSGVRSGSFDLLLPIFDTDADLVFTQLGIRRSNVRTESYRNTINLGAGWRHTLDKWLFGANAFYDRDTTGRNDRIGIGAEAWTDYVKLSANSYFRLTNWKVSPDLDDYLERPANGWDVRAEAYLPAYPQLGGKLAYEQYYGSEVGLFSATDRQKNPSAVTVGLNYAPVPALVFGADYRQGQGGISETTVKMGINYQFGVPLAKQWSPDQVKASRLLTNARYDLVSRNNEIVLDYKKAPAKGTVSLPSTLSAYGNTALTFVVTIAGDVSNIGWLGSGAQFALPYNGSALGTIVLPPYTPAGPNTYQLQAVGTVRGGEPVTSNVMTVTVLPLALLLERSKAVAKADGTDEVTFTATVTGTNAEPVAERSITWKVSGDASLVESSQRTDARGKAFARLTSRNVGRIDVQAVESDGLAADSEATFTAGAAASVGLTAQPPNIPADGTTTTTLTATVNDASGHSVGKGVVVDWSTSAGTLAGASSTTDDKGMATIALTSSTVAGLANVVAKANQATATASVAFAIGTAAGVSLTASPSSITANGTSTSTLTATVKDAHGNLVPAGVPVTWKTSAGTLASGSSNTNASGVASVVLTSSTAAGSATVDATAGTGTASAPVAFVAGTAAGVSLTASPSSITANGTSTSTLTATVKDAHGNTAPAGVPVTWHTSAGTLASGSSSTNASGVASVVLTSSTAAGSATVDATAGTGTASVPVAFVVGTAASVSLTASPSSITADGMSTSTLTATVKDAHGNAVPGASVTWHTSAGTLASGSSSTNASGVATVVLTSSTAAGSATVDATAGTGNASALVTFVAGAASGVSLTASPSSITANGTSTSTLTATVKDAHGNAVPGASVTWHTSAGTLASGSSSTNASGVATVVLTSSTAAGSATVDATAGTGTASALVAFVAGIPASVSLTASPSSITADGTSTSTLTATVKDAHGNAVPGASVTWHTSAGTLASGSSSTNASGVATVVLTSSTAAGSATVDATAGTGNASALVYFEADTNTAKVVSVVATPGTIEANVEYGVQLVATVKDAHGNLVPANVPVTWSATGGDLAQVTTFTDASGKTSNAFGGNIAGSYTITASAVGGSAGTVVSVIANVGQATVVSLVASPSSILADGVSTSTLTATVEDENGNRLGAGIPVSWTNSAGVLSAGVTYTDASGRATNTLTSSIGLFTATVGARVGSKSQRTTTVAFIADSSRPKVQSLVASPTTIVANGISSSTLTATVTDDKGNPLGAGFAVTWGTTSGTTLSNVASVTDSAGKATATLTGTVASVATVTAGASAGSATANVLLIADIATPSVASITATPASIPADNNTTSTIEVVLTDAQSNKLGAGIPVTWTTTWGTLLQSSTVTDASGKTSVQLKGPYSGPASVKASTSFHSMTTTVQLTPDPNTSAVRTLTASPTGVIANGVAYTTLTGYVTDGNGNLSTGQKVRWSTNDIGVFSEPESIVDATGTVTVRMTSTKAGVAYPQASTNYGYIIANVFFNADPATASVDSITASSATVPADGTPVTITLKLIDANGSPVPYTNVSWTSTLNNLSRATTSTGSDGTTSVTLSGTNLGTAQVKATVTSSGATGTVTVTFQ